MSGLEALGVAASILQVADAGLRLSKTIYAYIESVSSADKRLGRVRSHVETTSQVVKEIGDVFSQTETAKLISNGAVKTACDAAEECKEVFEELREVIEKSRRRKWVFPFKEQKLELLSAQLEKLKSTLHCLMTLLIHARMLKDNRPAPAEKRKIAELIREKNDAAARYGELKRNHDFIISHLATNNLFVMNTVQVQEPNHQIPNIQRRGVKETTSRMVNTSRGLSDDIPSPDSDTLSSTLPSPMITRSKSPAPSLQGIDRDVHVRDHSQCSSQIRSTTAPVEELETTKEATKFGLDLDLCIQQISSLLKTVEQVQKELRKDETKEVLLEAKQDLRREYLRQRENINIIFERTLGGTIPLSSPTHAGFRSRSSLMSDNQRAGTLPMPLPKSHMGLPVGQPIQRATSARPAYSHHTAHNRPRRVLSVPTSLRNQKSITNYAMHDSYSDGEIEEGVGSIALDNISTAATEHSFSPRTKSYRRRRSTSSDFSEYQITDHLQKWHQAAKAAAVNGYIYDRHTGTKRYIVESVVGGLAANRLTDGNEERYVSRGRSMSRSRSRGREDSISRSRSRIRSLSRGGRRDGDENRKKWQQAAKAAVVTDVIEAARSRNEPGPWTVVKGQRIATAALAAGGIDGFLDQDPNKRYKSHIVESVRSRSISRSRSRSRTRSRSRSRWRSRDRDSSESPFRNGRSRNGNLQDVAAPDGITGTGKAIYDRVRSKSRRRGRRSPSASSEDSDSEQQEIDGLLREWTTVFDEEE